MKVTIEEFKKIEIRIGRVVSCARVDGSNRLLRLEVDFGFEVGRRRILSGIAEWYGPDDLIGRLLPFIVNLEPRRMMGLESEGMLVAVDASPGAVLLEPQREVAEGSCVI